MTKQKWEDLAHYYLHGEQVRVYEQLVNIYNNAQTVNCEALQLSYKLFVHSLKNISEFFQTHDLDFEYGSSQKGTYLEFEYTIFARLNAELPQDMAIMYGANCVHFSQYSVKLYSEIAQSLPDEILKKYSISAQLLG